jgi:hypothetical protein
MKRGEHGGLINGPLLRLEKSPCNGNAIVRHSSDVNFALIESRSPG